MTTIASYNPLSTPIQQTTIESVQEPTYALLNNHEVTLGQAYVEWRWIYQNGNTRKLCFDQEGQITSPIAIQGLCMMLGDMDVTVDQLSFAGLKFLGNTWETLIDYSESLISIGHFDFRNCGIDSEKLNYLAENGKEFILSIESLYLDEDDWDNQSAFANALNKVLLQTSEKFQILSIRGRSLESTDVQIQGDFTLA